MTYFLLVIWFVLLIKWADFLVDGAGSIAKKFGISSLVIGLTVVAFGTSAPEFVVSFVSLLDGKSDLAISNVVGSNIANIALILWITALIYHIKMPQSTVKKEVPFAILISFVLLLLLSDVIFWFGESNILSRIDGIILLIFFWYFLYYSYSISKNTSEQDEEEIPLLPIWKSIIFVIGWLSGLIYGWNMVVENAVQIAQSFGLSNAFIGVTIIAIGTSLPELASSVVAALKKNTDMALGWIIWSNIFNILWILGFSSLFKNLESYPGVTADLLIMLFSVTLVMIFAFTGKKFIIGKIQWSILIILYFSYIWYLISQI